MNKLKVIISLALIAGGIFAYHYFEDVGLLYRVLGLLVVVGAAIGVFVTTETGASVISFGRSAVMEMRKTVWPTRRETMQTTLIVVVMVFIIGLIIWIIDSILGWIVRSLI